MSNRHLARTIVLQALFQWDFNGKKERIEEILKRNLNEFAPGLDDSGFSENLLEGIIKNFKKIDHLITKNAPQWPLEQITILDRNVLRIGIYELKFSQEIPPKVAINEAIELAKSFSSDSSGKFVNGVLGTIYKEMEEKGEKKELEVSPIPKEVCAGGIIYCQIDNRYKFVVILDAYGKWTLPKGHVEKDEQIEETALREIEEETGIKNLKLVEKIGETEYEIHQPQHPPFLKRVYFFLFETTYQPLALPQLAEVKDVKWLEAEEALAIISYDNVKVIFETALKKLKLVS